MARNHAAPVGRFPMRFLTVAVILTGVVLAWSGWTTYDSYRLAIAARQRDFKIAQLRGTIIYLGEVLTMSVRMAAATGESGWEKRYRHYEPKLEEAVKAITSVAGRAYERDPTVQLDTANRRLLEMDNEAFEFARQGDLESAQSVLGGAEHRAQRRIRGRVLYQLGVARDSELRLEELRGTIVYLDEVLTMSARMAAATGDLRWENRYRAFESRLAAAIEEAKRTAPDAYTGEAAAQTDEANVKLVEMENRAFGLIRQDRLQDSRDILLSDEYKTQKRIYAEGMAEFAARLTDTAKAALRSEQRMALLRLSLAGLVIFVLLAGWLVVLRNMLNWRAVLSARHRELARQAGELAEVNKALDEKIEQLQVEIAERKRAQEALGKAHEDLELRVQRRTAQLTSANEELGREIAERRRAEAAIRDSEALYSSLVESLPIHVLRKDLDGRFTYANQSFCELIGKPLEEVVGKTDFDLYPAELAEKYRLNDRKVAETGELFEDVEENRQDGETHYVHVMKSAVRDASGTIIGVQLIFWDVTKRKKAEAALEQERYLLNTMMDNLPHNIYFKDRESRFIRINKALTDCFGLSDHSEALGKTDFDYFTEEHARPAMADEQEIMRSGRPIVEKEERETWASGHTTWATTTKMPLYDDQGQIVGTFGISRDITEQKRAEEALRNSEMKFRTLFDSSRDAIMLLAPQEKFLSGNPAAIELFACENQQQFTSCTPADLSPERQPDGTSSSEKAARIMAIAMEAGSHFFEWKHKRIDGTEFLATVLLTRMELEGEKLLQATVRDVTKEKRAAEALRAAKEAAEAASRAKSDFLAHMSHEIRTPMNAIIGVTELVLDTELTQSQRNYLRMVEESADSLLSVINDILDFSKIEAGKLELQRSEFDLRESLGDTLRSLAFRAHGRGLELASHVHADVPQCLIGDAGRLRQVVVNLVGNAIRFTEAGEVVVEVRCESESDDRVILQFAVTDTGIGIPEEKRGTIFDAFEQADSSPTRQYGGTGLGLAISSRLIKRMDGRIWVESELGRGSTFRFTARFEPARGEAAAKAGLPVFRDTRVLAVDDNATNRLILEEMLANWGMRPTAVAGARDALRLLRQAHEAGDAFRLVVTDANMPELDGFYLAEQIRQEGLFGNTVIMMLTSGNQSGDVSRCEQLGVTAYLLKPIKQSELFDAIAMALGVTVPQDEDLATPGLQRTLPPRPLRILLAEDSLVNQKLAAGLLEKHGHTVVVAGDGKQAVTMCHSQDFDLVLMDVQMPEMDGLEATAAIRTRERQTGAHIPIIAMTAHAMKGDRERCLESGMDDYVAKPIRAQQLFEAIQTVLGASAEARPRPEGETHEVEIVDWSEALKSVKGDRALLKEIVEAFLQEVPRLMETIRQAIADADSAALQIAAHTLKGPAGYLGAAQAFEQAWQLEQMARGGDLKNAETYLAALEGEMEPFIAILQDYSSGKQA